MLAENVIDVMHVIGAASNFSPFQIFHLQSQALHVCVV